LKHLLTIFFSLLLLSGQLPAGVWECPQDMKTDPGMACECQADQCCVERSEADEQPEATRPPRSVSLNPEACPVDFGKASVLSGSESSATLSSLLTSIPEPQGIPLYQRTCRYLI
jgi:hypothetical protein